MKRKRRNLIGAILAVLILGGGLYLILRQSGSPVIIDKKLANSSLIVSGDLADDDSGAPKSPVSGLACDDSNRRPIAVMLSGDAAARPLSGISEADLVFEMPVITSSITRLLAVYVCGNPSEIGSVRSARHDFIPLAMGLDAIFVHWGGSHFALEELAKGSADNIDALKNPFNVYYRKAGVASPHNGFSSMNRIISAAGKLNFRLENKFIGYQFLPSSESNKKEAKTLLIAYPGEFKVKYEYDPASNSYLRFKNGKPEADRSTKQQVAAKNVVIMRAESRQIEGQYNDVDVEGEGLAIVYRNGEEKKGTWKKDKKDQASKLYFYDSRGQEIKFVSGQIWVEIVQSDQSVTWQ